MLVIDCLAPVGGRHLKVVAHDYGFNRAHFDAQPTVEATRLVDFVVIRHLLGARFEWVEALHVVVLEGLPLIKVLCFGAVVLDDANRDAVHRADLRAEAAAHALITSRFRVRQQAHSPPEARRKVSHLVRILHRDSRLEKLP